MCGIAGIFSAPSSTQAAAEISQDRLRQSIGAMQAALDHRGPDDRGLYFADQQPVALAHTRLSILDLSAAGQQPMASPDGRYWIVFNGEIYNFRELRSQLEAEGEHFQTQTDTEVILRLYHHHGKDCLALLRGMFAFAIWDSQQQCGFCARDPLGIKPFYYWQKEKTLAFASEIRALVASGLTTRQLDPLGLYGYFLTGSVPEPHTLIEGVRTLEAGSWLQWRAGEITQGRYWQIKYGADASLAETAPARVRQALLDSVRAHYVSDVPVGVFLSGGIDSTAVVALSRQVHSGPIHSYSIAFEDPRWNEGDLACRVAQTFGTEHTEQVMTAAEGRALLNPFLRALDQPSIDGFNTFCVAQLARDHGQKVVLSGLGGDELFAGYSAFERLPRMTAWGQRLNKLKPLTQLAAKGLSRRGPNAKWRRLGDFLQRPTSLTAAYQSFRGIFSQAEAARLFQHFLPGAALPIGLAQDTGQQPSLADEISALELSGYMRNQLLRDSDVMSMACGLELRVPWVDRALIETIADIPSAQRLALGKQLLVQAVPEIPEWIVNRPKQGFRFPFDQWFATEWADVAGEFAAIKGVSLQPWYRRWSVMVLQYWLQEVLG